MNTSDVGEHRTGRKAVRLGLLAGCLGAGLTVYAFAAQLSQDAGVGDTPGALYVFGTIVSATMAGGLFFFAAWGLTHLVDWARRKWKGQSRE